MSERTTKETWEELVEKAEKDDVVSKGLRELDALEKSLFVIDGNGHEGSFTAPYSSIPRPSTKSHWK
jgi:hypothetical protein